MLFKWHLQEWKAVQILIGKTGKESLKRRISEFKVEKLNIELAMKAKQVLEKFSLDEVRDVSAGGGTFYVWVRWANLARQTFVF